MSDDIEIWKAAPYSPLYEISTHGRVRRLPSYVATSRGNGKRFHKGGMLTLSRQKDGYSYVRMSIDGRIVTKCVHVLVAETFLLKPNVDGLEVDHINHDPACNYLWNLRWVTVSLNQLNQKRATLPKSGHECIQFVYGKCWCVRFRRKHIGSYRSLEAAIAARDAARKDYIESQFAALKEAK